HPHGFQWLHEANLAGFKLFGLTAAEVQDAQLVVLRAKRNDDQRAHLFASKSTHSFGLMKVDYTDLLCCYNSIDDACGGLLSHMLAIHCQILMIAKSTMGDGFQRLSRCRYKANHPDIEPTDFGSFVQNRLHHQLEIKRVQNRTADLLQRLQLTRAVRRIICTKLTAIKSGWSVELTHSGSDSEN